MKAFLKNYRQSPRKVRLVADSIRGKKVEAARALLDVLPKRAALPVKKLLMSAVANAKSAGALSREEDLYVREIRVDEGPTLKRQMPRAFGRSAPIRKRTSHISLILAEQEKGKSQITKPKAQTNSNVQNSKLQRKSFSKPLTPRT
ncbi:MAG: 50S ribosomal protein L22 [Parcubacteria group bacterium]|nr:50S ribosomal protein L22 [Parcubacteria group bacterium]MBI2049084.1 50S ribosomal protein L22 [Parcubacteria group bacterium]